MFVNKFSISSHQKLALSWLAVLFFVPLLFLLTCRLETTVRLPFILAAERLLIIFAMLLFWHVSRTADGQALHQQEIVFFVLLGLILRVGYMLALPATHFQHDIGAVPGQGHAAYIMQLLNGHSLPPSYNGQFYHPPLFHALAALGIAVLRPFCHPETVMQMLEAAKIIPCLASCATLPVFVGLCRECGARGRFQVLAVALFAFFPNLIIVSGRINNDSLVLLFIMLCLLFTLRWHRNPSWGNILMLALAFGLGVMTKLSGALPALLTGPVMLHKWHTEIRSGHGKRLFLQLLLFAAVSFPPALWHPIRNLLLFQQPLGYILTPPGGVNSSLYCGGHGFAQRFLAFPFWELANHPFCRPFDDWNLPLYVIRCSVFGEFVWKMPLPLAKLLTFVNLPLAFLSLCGVFFLPFTLLRGRKSRSGKNPEPDGAGKALPAALVIPTFFILFLVSHLIFNLRFPFGCTMDFRYIMPCAAAGILSLCLSLQWLCESGHNGAWKLVWPFAAFFCTLSAVLYTSITL